MTASRSALVKRKPRAVSPVMKMAEMPKVETLVVPSGGFWGGVGEPTICVVAPAVMNAVFAATGKPVREVLPEIEGQGFFELLDSVYASGEPYGGRAMPVDIQYSPGALR